MSNALQDPHAVRAGRAQRSTKETEIRVELVLPDDAPSPPRIDTQLPFFSHMLEALGRHSAMDLMVHARGDVEIDGHHTVEDTGIVLGKALDNALGERHGIVRYGHSLLPMDEVLVDVAIDLGGRPYLVWNVPSISGKMVGAFDCDLVKEFMQALVVSARMNLHVHERCGGNAHHVVEACFKGLARALRMASRRDAAFAGVAPSTKGSLV